MASRTPHKPQSTVAKPAPAPIPEEITATPIEEVVEVPTVVEEVEEPTPSEEVLVTLQQAAEETTPEPKTKPVEGTHEVRFCLPHTFGNRVYVDGDIATVPSDHPFYGMSPKEQEEKYGEVHFIPVK